MKKQMKNFLNRRSGQSTVEMALLLPIFAGILLLVIYVFRVNHEANNQTSTTYAYQIEKFDNGNGLVYDPVTGTYVPAGQYYEHLPPDAAIDLGQIADIVTGQIAQLGLSELFSHLHIFKTETYAGAFAQGFTQSLASSAVSTYMETGSLHDMSASDLESAAWAGVASAFSSQAATEDFQGGEGSAAGTITGAQELFGSGAQAGIINFAQSEGEWQAGVTGALGGMMNSDTSADWMDDGKSLAQIMKGAGKGAVQSSINGVFSENLDAKSVLVGAATGAVSTQAFASTLAPSSSDPMSSVAYSAFNAGFSTILSGGDIQTTLIATGAGALGSGQISDALGNFGTTASSMGYNAGTQLLQGQSLQTVGMSALVSAGSMGVGWGINKVSSGVSNLFNNAQTSGDVTTIMDGNNTTETFASEYVNQSTMDEILEALNSGLFNAEYLNSLLAQQGDIS